MAFATDNLINPIQSVVPGTISQSEGSIPPPPGFETTEAGVPNSTPSFDVFATNQAPETPVVETAKSADTAPAVEVQMEPELVEEAPALSVEAAVAMVNLAAAEQQSETSSAVISAGTRVFSRRVDSPDAEFNVGRPKNPSLNYAIELFFNTVANADGTKENVEDALAIHGEIIKRTGEYGLWEEGGATANEARAILVTNPDGSKPIPFFVFTRQTVVNSKHALVPVKIGSYIVIGGRKGGECIILVYRVDGVIEPSGEFANHRYDSQLIAYHAYNSNSADPGVFVCFSEDDSQERQIWVESQPALEAMRKRLQTIHASVPAYVADYHEHRFDSTDFNDCITDSEFVGRAVIEKSLEDAYQHAGDILGELIADGIKEGEFPHLVVSLSYNPEMDAIAVFCMAKVYVVNNKSSRGKRLYYSRTILPTGSSFYYPDKTIDNAVPFDRIKEILTKAGGAMATSFRRMTVKS